MKKIILYGVALSLSVSMMGCTVKENTNSLSKNEQKQIEVEVEIDKEKLEKDEVENLVKGFGGKLQFVSLLSSKDVLEKDMKENYGEFVSQELLEEWINDSDNAPGRLTSSPWPDSIEIDDIEKLSEIEYKVEGKIIEKTSNENDGEITQPITLSVKMIDEKWLIDNVILGE